MPAPTFVRGVGLGALAAAILVAPACWFAQDWRYGEKIAAREAELADAHAEQVRNVLTAERNSHAKVEKALSGARAREAGQRLDADAVRSELSRLRDETAAAERLSEASPGACRERVSALRDVFDQCAARYGDLAEKAGRHASDVRTLIEAWPADGAASVPSMADSPANQPTER